MKDGKAYIEVAPGPASKNTRARFGDRDADAALLEPWRLILLARFVEVGGASPSNHATAVNRLFRFCLGIHKMNHRHVAQISIVRGIELVLANQRFDVLHIRLAAF